jgi:2-phospho-L-lactate guanylyltransferase
MKRRHFVALVPVKPPAQGKSRMQGVSDEERVRLAAAFARDVVAASLATPVVDRVMAVTDDARFAAGLAAAGCEVLPDGVADDLNETLRLAALEAYRRWPDLTPLAVCADLPALRPDELATALAEWPGRTAGFVADAEATGTTLYVAEAVSFAPAFGAGSYAAHLAAGAVELGRGLPSLRRDVDDLAALVAARELGLGEHTAAAVAEVAALAHP